jgi:hypothetical protein
MTRDIQTRGNHPKEGIRHSEQAESLKSLMESLSLENEARNGI